MGMFFQAEDGIRDPIWSRGLGAVYKIQVIQCHVMSGHVLPCNVMPCHVMSCPVAVSYTHLTLPMNREVWRSLGAFLLKKKTNHIIFCKHPVYPQTMPYL